MPLEQVPLVRQVSQVILEQLELVVFKEILAQLVLVVLQAT